MNFREVFNRYNPKVKGNHSILKYYASELDENNCIQFIQEIFKLGVWSLPSEIAKESQSEKIKNAALYEFEILFSNWTNERIDYSSILEGRTKNPKLKNEFIPTFSQALISISNLDFDKRILSILNNFFLKTDEHYLEKFLEKSFGIFLEELDVVEIEYFIRFFILEFEREQSSNIKKFFFYIFSELTNSIKVHYLSDSFKNEDLTKLLRIIEKPNTEFERLNIYIIFLISYLKEKRLNLNDERFNELTYKVISELPKGKYSNLKEFQFLKRYNYQFNEFNFNEEITSFFSIMKSNLDPNPEMEKMIGSYQHYWLYSKTYFEYFIFLLNNLENNYVSKYVNDFVTIINEIRSYFNELPWYIEFNEFKEVKGRIKTKEKEGYKIEIISNEITSNFQLNYLYKNDRIKSGFLLNFDLLNFLQKGQIINDTSLIPVSVLNQEYTFVIKKINYYENNSGELMHLIPFQPTENHLIIKSKLMNLISELELFFLNKLLEITNQTKTYNLGKNQYISRLFNLQILNLQLEIPESLLLNIIKENFPEIYNEFYIKYQLKERRFVKIQNIYLSNSSIKGKIISRDYGGFTVRIMGLNAFLPGSQTDIRPIRDYDSYIGKELEFKILQISSERNIIVSSRQILEERLEIDKGKILNQIEVGLVVKGYVKNITSYGIFVDIGGIDGLIHISDTSWVKINHPSEVVELDEEIEVCILSFNEDKSQLSLGLKQLKPNPYDDLKIEFRIGQRINGQVKYITEYGAFIELFPGIEGLLHISELSWNKRITNIEQVISIGEIIEVIILEFNRSERKLVLSRKQLNPNPWLGICERYNLGKKYAGVIQNVNQSFFFVSLEEGITGTLPHNSKTNNLRLKINDKLDVYIKKICEHKKQIHLTLNSNITKSSQLVYSDIKINKVYDSVVIKIHEHGLIVSLSPKVTGWISKTHLIRNNVYNNVMINQLLKVKVIDIDLIKKNIKLIPIIE